MVLLPPHGLPDVGSVHISEARLIQDFERPGKYARSTGLTVGLTACPADGPMLENGPADSGGRSLYLETRKIIASCCTHGFRNHAGNSWQIPVGLRHMFNILRCMHPEACRKRAKLTGALLGTEGAGSPEGTSVERAASTGGSKSAGACTGRSSQAHRKPACKCFSSCVKQHCKWKAQNPWQVLQPEAPPP